MYAIVLNHSNSELDAAYDSRGIAKLTVSGEAVRHESLSSSKQIS